MYKYEKTIMLVTTASPLNQNLALLDPNEFISADSLASIHEGYINIIPLFNSLNRRCKYVPVENGKNRGNTVVKQIKWVRMNGETLFIVASTIGIQIYDAEVSDVKFFHSCTTTDSTNAICTLEKNLLCIGTNLGNIWIFRSADVNNSEFETVDFFQAHNGPIHLLDGTGKYLVSSSDDCTYLWSTMDKQLEISRQIRVSGLFSKPSALKVANYLIFLGYESGEFCVFDIVDKTFLRSRTVAHKLKITGIDFSVLKHYVLTGSEDCYAKIWTFDESSTEGTCIFSIFNETGPICGIGFLNYNCTEFCAITANSVAINVYIMTNDTTEK